MKILTHYDPKPVPSTAYDWSAVDADTYDGAPDSGNRHQIGWGATEAEAIADLHETICPGRAEALNDASRALYYALEKCERLGALRGDYIGKAVAALNDAEFPELATQLDQLEPFGGDGRAFDTIRTEVDRLLKEARG